MKKLSILLSALLMSGVLATATEPTDVRSWKSTDGRTILGRATALTGDTVTIVLTSNKTVSFSISKLELSHQMYVKDHFAVTEEAATKIADAPAADNKGKATKDKNGKKGRKGGGGLSSEKQDSSEGSFYYYHVPSTAPASDRQAIFWSGAKAATGIDISRYSLAAELTGMTIVACGNSNNHGTSNGSNSDNMKRNIEHSMEKLKISAKRLFFAGSSGGGQRSLQNADKFKSAGGMPIVAYIGSTSPSKGYYYAIGGAYDFNRFATAGIAKKLGDTAIHTIVPGGHGNKDSYSLNDGCIWLYTCNAYLKKTAGSDELSGFEDRFYDYLTTELSDEPWRAYYWTNHLLNTCKMKGSNHSKFETLHSTLEADPKNILYLEGREALEKLSEKYMADVSLGSVMGKSNKEVNKAAAKFVEKYGEIPRLKQIGMDLQKKTDKLGAK